MKTMVLSILMRLYVPCEAFSNRPKMTETESKNYKLVKSSVALNEILKYYVSSRQGSCVKFLIFREKKTMGAFTGTVSYMTDDLLIHLCIIKTVGVTFVALLIC